METGDYQGFLPTALQYVKKHYNVGMSTFYHGNCTLTKTFNFNMLRFLVKEQQVPKFPSLFQK